MQVVENIGHQRQPSHQTQDGLVSIITPAFHAKGTIEDTVRSVLTQTYKHWEMLIVSDDGTDYERFLANKGMTDSRLRFFTSAHPKSGPNAARNIALRQAKGEYIAPLDADDLFYSTRLDKLVPLAAEYGMAGDNVSIVDGITNEPIYRLFVDSNRLRWMTMNDFTTIATPLLFVFRRNIIDAYWDEDISMGADTLFNLRCLEKVGKAPFVDEALHDYRIMPNSLCHSENAHQREDKAYAYSLQKLERDGLGFKSTESIDLVRRILKSKRKLNQRFMESRKRGECGSFADFIAMDNSPRLVDQAV